MVKRLDANNKIRYGLEWLCVAVVLVSCGGGRRSTPVKSGATTVEEQQDQPTPTVGAQGDDARRVPMGKKPKPASPRGKGDEDFDSFRFITNVRVQKAHHDMMHPDPNKDVKDPQKNELESGEVLYQKNCQTCHMELAKSDKKGASADTIAMAIQKIPQMQHLRTLSGEAVRRIADAMDIGVGFKGSQGKNPFECAAMSSAPQADVDYLARLSKKQYLLLLKSEVGEYLSAAQWQEIVNLAPSDSKVGIFDHFDQGISIDHIQSYYTIARKIADVTAKNDSFRQRHFACGNYDTACARRFAEGLGAQLLRRPWSADFLRKMSELFVEAAQSSREEAVRVMMMVVLQSPGFIYRLELGESVSGQGTLRLSREELAHRLAFALTNQPADAALLQAARAGQLGDSQGLRRHALQLIRSEKGKTRVREFLQFLFEYYEQPDPNYSSHFAMGINAGQLYREAEQELDAYFEDVIWTQKGDYQDFILGRRVVRSSPTLDRLYFPEGKPATGLLPAERPGPMARVAFLTTGRDETHLVHRGLLVRRNLLCDQIGTPNDIPAEQLAPPVPNPKSSTREQIETRTSPAFCQSCHAKINPPGFVLESFDSLGRMRTHENIYNKNGSQIIAALPIVAKTMPNIDHPSDPEVQSYQQFVEAIAQSSAGPGCLTKQWYEFVKARPAKERDLCQLKTMYDRLVPEKPVQLNSADLGPIAELLLAAVLAPEFRLLIKR
ncbi:MAG: DUF1588 domain-containing protein [Zetaproteobacteria bacterium]|nr:DUF1588 domain-containing protein [Zetaproteobacteria bacterium]